MKAMFAKIAIPFLVIAGLIVAFFNRKGPDKETVEAQDELADALKREIRNRRDREVEDADKELEDRRSGTVADRLAGALARARKRAGGDPGTG